MAGMIEQKSVRALAFILALIMIGSVIAFAFRGTTRTELRTIKFDMGSNLRSFLNYVPSDCEYIAYFNYTTYNGTMLMFTYNSTVSILRTIDPYAFYIIRPNDLQSFKRLLIATPELYFIDLNRSKVYFSFRQKVNYGGYTVKLEKFLGRPYALADEIHPAVYGYPVEVLKVINFILGRNKSFNDVYGNYTSRIPGNFNYAVILSGKAARESVRSNNTSVADFYFVGYRMNGSMFEKVVGIHFLGNYFFVRTKKVAYCYCRNYPDGFSVAVMDDRNLTKLINTTPEIRAIIVKIGRSQG